MSRDRGEEQQLHSCCSWWRLGEKTMVLLSVVVLQCLLTCSSELLSMLMIAINGDVSSVHMWVQLLASS